MTSLLVQVTSMTMFLIYKDYMVTGGKGNYYLTAMALIAVGDVVGRIFIGIATFLQVSFHFSNSVR